jgi:hypothetical protein
VLALDATTVRVLRRYREEQERWYRAHGRIASGYVFTALDGGPMSPDYLTQTFTQLVKASGLTPVRGCTTCGTARPASPWPPGWT